MTTAFHTGLPHDWDRAMRRCRRCGMTEIQRHLYQQPACILFFREPEKLQAARNSLLSRCDPPAEKGDA